jgi:hypothetical protein
MKRSWPYVYFWRASWWCDTGKKFGSRKRKKFLTEDEAKEQADTWRTEQRKGGSVANLSDQQRLDAVMGLRLMEEHRVKESLFDAVRYFVERKYFHAYSRGNVTELMNRLGHSQSKTTLDNYTSFLVEIEDSEAFWSILPKGMCMPKLPDDEKDRRSLLLNLLNYFSHFTGPLFLEPVS